jgi:DNA-binding transcriptional ArsR family regulator
VSQPESQPPLLDVFTIDRPEQLKALGHPLRLRVLEMLGQSEEASLTNRELAQRLGVDPGHLHFHVRMLLRAGLIDLADGGKGREKPYRAVARTVRVAPELVSSGLGTDVRASMLDDLQRAWASFGSSGKFRITQTTVRIPAERALRLIEEIAEQVRDEEIDDAEPLVITAFMHPVRTGSTD